MSLEECEATLAEIDTYLAGFEYEAGIQLGKDLPEPIIQALAGGLQIAGDVRAIIARHNGGQS